jgi:hypothetical protein
LILDIYQLEQKYLWNGSKTNHFSFSGSFGKSLLVISIFMIPLNWIKKVETLKVIQTIGVLALIAFVALSST